MNASLERAPHYECGVPVCVHTCPLYPHTIGGVQCDERRGLARICHPEVRALVLLAKRGVAESYQHRVLELESGVLDVAAALELIAEHVAGIEARSERPTGVAVLIRNRIQELRLLAERRLGSS